MPTQDESTRAKVEPHPVKFTCLRSMQVLITIAMFKKHKEAKKKEVQPCGKTVLKNGVTRASLDSNTLFMILPGEKPTTMSALQIVIDT